jgi:hypothetical protein
MSSKRLRVYVDTSVIGGCGDGALSPNMIADAQHIAVATVARVDVLVSWNFKHIVNLGRIRRYNSVNLREGYALLEIRSPQEVLQDESEDQEV